MASRRLVRFELLVRLVDVLSFSLNQAVPPLSFQSSTAANASDEPPPSENGTIKLEAIALEAESSGMRRRPPAGRAQRDSNACARTTRTATRTPARDRICGARGYGDAASHIGRIVQFASG